MPDLTAAELSIPAEQHPDPAKPLVIPVDSTVVGSTLRFIPWSVVGNPAFLQLPPPPPGMQPSWVQIPQWVAISALLPFSEPEPAVATHFDRLSVLRLAVLAAAWRRILGALSDLGVFSTVHVDEDAFRTVCIQALHSRQIPVPELYLQWGDLGYSEAITPLGPAPSAEAKLACPRVSSRTLPGFLSVFPACFPTTPSSFLGKPRGNSVEFVILGGL